jgi:hypothetical protein
LQGELLSLVCLSISGYDLKVLRSEQAKLITDVGNVGFLTGPPFFAAIAAYVNGADKVAIQGVDYPADIAGFLAGGSPLGGIVMYVPPSLPDYHAPETPRR